MWFEREFNKRKVKRDFKWHHRWDEASVNNKEARNEKKSINLQKRNIRWKPIIGIAMVTTAILLDMPIIFGLLYIIWAVNNIRYGEAFILETVTRAKNPVLYWMTTLLWLFSGIYVFVYSLINN